MNASFPVSSRVSLRDALAAAWHDRSLHAILLVFLALTLAWNFITPIFEAPDEPDHLQFVLFIADTGRLPDLLIEAQQAGFESFQPPLYYFILSSALRITGVSHPFVHPTQNPQFDFNRMDSSPNYFLPSAGSYGYVHFLRAFSTLFGLVTVLCTYLAAALLRADRTQTLTATAVTAFLPQFTFISGAVNSDSLAYALTALGFVWLLNVANASSPRVWQMIVFGIGCGVAFITKSHAAIFLLSFGLATWVLTYSPDWRQVLKCAFLSVIGFLPVAGWLGVYNQWRYGDPFALRVAMMNAPQSVIHHDLFDVTTLLYYTVLLPRLLFQSFLGTYGWMRIFLPDFFYGAFAILWLGALAGTAYAMLKTKWDLGRKLVLIAPLCMLALLVYVNWFLIAPQGRYLFPAIGALSLALVLGLAELPPLIRRPLLIATPFFLLLTNFYSLWLVASTLPRW